MLDWMPQQLIRPDRGGSGQGALSGTLAHSSMIEKNHEVMAGRMNARSWEVALSPRLEAVGRAVHMQG